MQNQGLFPSQERGRLCAGGEARSARPHPRLHAMLSAPGSPPYLQPGGSVRRRARINRGDKTSQHPESALAPPEPTKQGWPIPRLPEFPSESPQARRHGRGAGGKGWSRTLSPLDQAPAPARNPGHFRLVLKPWKFQKLLALDFSAIC